MQDRNISDMLEKKFISMAKAIDEKIPELAKKYNVTEEDIRSSISVQIYRNFEKHKNASTLTSDTVIGLLSEMGFSYSSPPYGNIKNIAVVPVSMPEPGILTKIEYNCHGVCFYTEEGNKRLVEKTTKYEKDIKAFKKSLSRGKGKLKRSEQPNPFQTVGDGVIVCGSVEDKSIRLGFMKPQEKMGAKKTRMKDYCGRYSCPIALGYKKPVYEIGGEEFINHVENMLKEKGVDASEIANEIIGDIKDMGKIILSEKHQENVPMYG